MEERVEMKGNKNKFTSPSLAFLIALKTESSQQKQKKQKGPRRPEISRFDSRLSQKALHESIWQV